MNIKRVCALYFSPTGGTEQIARFAAAELAQRLGAEVEAIDFTRPENREREYRFSSEDLVLVAAPVYAGRVPNKILPDFQSRVFGSGATPAVPLSVFGNRSEDEALRELALLLEGNGFQLAGAAALVCRHAFSQVVGAGRPDEADWVQVREFAGKVAEKLSAGETMPLLVIERSEIGPYYTPLKVDGTPARFLKAKPQTDQDKCTHCGLCVRACPMGSIDEITMEAAGVCIKCQACVRRCPQGAKYFTDGDFLSHVAMLEQNYSKRAENTWFV